MAPARKRHVGSEPPLGEPVRIDVANACVWCGEAAVRLTPRAFAVLRYLLEHRDRIVTRDELFQAVWPGVVVSDVALAVCVSELRQALGDAPQTPRFIETVHRRGYRFIGPIAPAVAAEGTPEEGPPRQILPSSSAFSIRHSIVSSISLVGRETELGHLQRWLEHALSGERQVVFVTSDPGMGKTTLVDAFLTRLVAEASLWVAWGQCIEQYGAGEAYLPVLTALGQLCRGPGGERLVVGLSHYAPTWLIQMPALLSAAELEGLQRRTLGATPERMLREFAEAVEAVTAEQPLVLVLEDLHWSDHATLDLVSFLARRREPARLLLLGTYRPAEAIVHSHRLKALKHELALHRQCVEVPLEGLSERAVSAYLAARLPGTEVPAGLARVLYQRTDGHPLFMVQVVDWWVQQGWVAELEGRWVLQVGLETLQAGVPESLRALIELRFEELSPEEQRLLEAASAAGVAFSTAGVAAGVDARAVEVEEQCAVLARRGQFLQACGVEEWPDGTVAGRYRFRHALFQQVVYDRLSVGRRTALHRRLGAREEAGYGEQAGERAAALAVHFERGRDYPRAVQYLRQAAATALGRNAYQEAIAHLTAALRLLNTFADTAERAQRELAVLLTLGPALIAAKGQGVAEVEGAYARAWELYQQVGEPPQLFSVLAGRWRLHLARGEGLMARELAAQCLGLAEYRRDQALLLEAHRMLGTLAFWQGDFAPARLHCAQGMAFYDPHQHRAHAFRYGRDPGVDCRIYAALTLWMLGYPEQAWQRSQEALSLGQELSHTLSLAYALTFAAFLHQLRREGPVAQAHAEALIALATAQGFPVLWADATIVRGWALAAQGRGGEGVAEIEHGLSAWRATGGKVVGSYFLALLAEAYGQVGQPAAGLAVLSAALADVQATGIRFYEAELQRLVGELLLQQAAPGVPPTVEAWLQQALARARRQGAKALELRAAMSLSRLWQQQGKQADAYELLAPIYGEFTEGFDTADLQGAKALLEALS